MGFNELHLELADHLDAIAEIAARYGLTTTATLVLRDKSSPEGSIVMTPEDNSGLVEVADTIIRYVKRKPTTVGTRVDALLGKATIPH